MNIIKEVEGIEKYPVLYNPAYLQSHNGVCDYGFFNENGVILPFCIRKKSIFKWVQLDSDFCDELSNEDKRRFLDGMVAYVKKHLRVSHILTTNTAIFDVYPTDSSYCKFGTYLVDLTQSEDELFKKIHSKHRNVIRKALTDGIIIEHGPNQATNAILLMQDTFERQNKVSGLGVSLSEKMEPLGDMVDYWVAKDFEGNLQGSAILLWNKGNSCYYMHGGSAAHTKPGAMNLLMWEAMKCMKERGVRWFDFVGARVTTEAGSKLEGIQRFKSRFGASMKVGYMFRVVVNKPYYWLYNLAVDFAYLFLVHKIPIDVIKEEREKGNL